MKKLLIKFPKHIIQTIYKIEFIYLFKRLIFFYIYKFN